MPAATIVGRLRAARPRLLEAAARLPLDTLRGDDAWGWVYFTLHGHYLDHLAVIEPWTDRLRDRQTDGDPFIADPRAADYAGFVADATALDEIFDALVRPVPLERWDEAEVTPGWTLRDHVGHLADWMDEGARAIAVHPGQGHVAVRPGGGDRCLERAPRRRGPDASRRLRRSLATTRHGRVCSPPSRR